MGLKYEKSAILQCFLEFRLFYRKRLTGNKFYSSRLAGRLSKKLHSSSLLNGTAAAPFLGAAPGDASSSCPRVPTPGLFSATGREHSAGRGSGSALVSLTGNNRLLPFTPKLVIAHSLSVEKLLQVIPSLVVQNLVPVFCPDHTLSWLLSSSP